MPTGYRLALSLHLLTVVALSAAAGIVHFAAARRSSARSLREAMQWSRVIAVTARTFPIGVVVAILTGGYMVGFGGVWSWSTGWVDAGLTSAAALIVGGIVNKTRSAAEGRINAARLSRVTRDLPNEPSGDRVIAALSGANPAIALATVLVMAMKESFAVSLAMLAVGAALGAYSGLARQRREIRAAAGLQRAA